MMLYIKGAFKRLFLCLLFFITTAALAEPADTKKTCSSELYDETSSVKYVHDGDTLRLNDGRKVRLIGINTPELGHKDKTAEPFSTEAKKALQSLLKDNKSITLLYGKDNKDHYGRILAHGFLANGQNVQAILLEKGLATAIIIPPNTQYAACYLELENTARCSKKGLWQNTKLIKAKKLETRHKGFQLVQGKVKSININKKGIWLNIDNRLTIGIRPDNQSLFAIKAINEMLNKTIIVRGWLNKNRAGKSNKSNPFYMRVRHPLSIQSASTFACR